MSSQVIRGQRLITADGIIDRPSIAVDGDGIITAIEPRAASADETSTISPAFFDIHVHGAAGADVMEGTRKALMRTGAFLATHGVGQFLATTVTAPMDATLRALTGIADAIEAAGHEWRGARPVGIHLEGPFISHVKRGVHPAASIQKPSIELFERFQAAARGHIKLLTVAPEAEGAADLIRHASASGVRVSVGHSNATAAETRAAIAAGASSATHTYNAMRVLDHREPGIAGVVLDDRELYAELIADGIHVSPEFVRLWWKAKGSSRAILVTDGISATGMPDGEHLLGGLEVTVADGRCLLKSDLASGKQTLAGSVLTMDRAVANLQSFTAATLSDAIHAAAFNPARMLGMQSIGKVAVGERANFNIFAANGTMTKTILNGRDMRGEDAY